MPTVALYRKYRPKNFDELSGQEPIAQSLDNAVQSERVSHAYLFSGPRGVGKTSAARILARALSPADEGANLDIIEIDGASNRRIDEIRDLREKVHLAPTNGKYKIYIIDEAHMLTTEAFNALLKTLEEPPSHVVFILATTEVHKLPATIVSRTQHYAFLPISAAVQTVHLRKIAQTEGISVEEAALDLIAAASEGSLRDSLSILDQAANTVGKSITATAIRALLGLADQQIIEDIAVALVERDVSKLVKSFDLHQARGGQAPQLHQQLLRLWHDILRCQLKLSTPLTKRQQWLIANTEIDYLARISLQLVQLPPGVSNSPIGLEAALVRLVAGNTKTDIKQPEPIIARNVPKALDVVEKSTSKRPKMVKSKAVSALTENLWLKALIMIKERNTSLYGLLRSADIELETAKLSLIFRFQFHLRRLNEPKNQQLLLEVLQHITGREIAIESSLAASVKATQITDSEPNKTADSQNSVNQVLQILGGEVIS